MLSFTSTGIGLVLDVGGFRDVPCERNGALWSNFTATGIAGPARVSRSTARAAIVAALNPRKARPEQKIEAGVELIMAIARCMAAQPSRSIYETRGLDFIELRRS